MKQLLFILTGMLLLSTGLLAQQQQHDVPGVWGKPNSPQVVLPPASIFMHAPVLSWQPGSTENIWKQPMALRPNRQQLPIIKTAASQWGGYLLHAGLQMLGRGNSNNNIR